MQYDYAQQMSKYAKKSPSELMTFMLAAAPLLAKYEHWKRIVNPSHAIAHSQHQSTRIQHALTKCNETHREFVLKFNCRSLPPKRHHVPAHCTSCGSKSCIIDYTEDASYVCSVCGISARYNIANSGAMAPYLQLVNMAPKPYMYRPIVYFEKCIQQVQGIHKQAFPKRVIRKLEQDFKSRCISYSTLDPDEILLALNRIGESQFYKHRWGLVKHFRPDYPLVIIPTEIIEQVKALFLGAIARFSIIVDALGIQRKNFISYPFFTSRAFVHIGFPEYAAYFGTLKSKTRHRIQEQILERILLDLTNKKQTLLHRNQFVFRNQKK